MTTAIFGPISLDSLRPAKSLRRVAEHPLLAGPRRPAFDWLYDNSTYYGLATRRRDQGRTGDPSIILPLCMEACTATRRSQRNFYAGRTAWQQARFERANIPLVFPTITAQGPRATCPQARSSWPRQPRTTLD